MAIESEIKFTVSDNSLFESIKTLGEIAGYRTVDMGMKKHNDTYFDTPDTKLFHGKSVFRLRESAQISVLTFKSHLESPGTYYQRSEVESETVAKADDICSGCMPEIAPAEAFRRKFGDVSLKTSLKAENNRYTILLTRDNKSHYELVLDDVTFSGPCGTAKVFELEVESLSGADNVLDAVGEWLTRRFDLKPAGPSKYILGMSLVGGVKTEHPG